MNSFQELIHADKPVLVDFYADWCGPCKAMTPIVREVAQTIEGSARVIKINIDKNQQAAQAYGIQGVPTFILFKQGKILWRHAGMIDKNGLLSIIRQNA
ncbi:MAG: thioredoxin [Chitinophagaceae bacterium]